MSGTPDKKMCESVQDASQHTGIEKRCSRCGSIKDLCEFYLSSDGSPGRRSWCKKCFKANVALRDDITKPQRKEAAARRYRAKHPKVEKQKVHGDIHAVKKQKVHRDAPKVKKRKVADGLRLEKNREAVRRYHAKHREKRNASARTYQAEKHATPRGRVDDNMRIGIKRALRGSKAGQRWVDLAGYTVEKLMKHLEKQFTPGMTWGNYGPYWHIDHKIPLSAFNYETPLDADFKRCWALKNLQPLEAKKNFSKNDRLDKPFQPMFAIAV
jgi:hypothetical protein